LGGRGSVYLEKNNYVITFYRKIKVKIEEENPHTPWEKDLQWISIPY
jgi:hypothetical protein